MLCGIVQSLFRQEISVSYSLAACENEEPEQSPKAFFFPDKKKTILTLAHWIRTLML